MTSATSLLNFKIISPNSQAYLEAVKLREHILRKPLGLKFHQNDLENEKTHIHIVGCIDGQPIATAILAPETKLCKMRQVAVREDFQGQGIATALLQFCEKQALLNGCEEIYCDVRKTASQLYLKNGYTSEGDYFEKITIPHIKMRKILK